VASNKVVILDEAVSEIAESTSFYNDQSPGLGSGFKSEVFRLIEVIQEHPLLFPVKFANIHEAVMSRFPFVITYEVYGDQIIISAVFHTKRHPINKTKRRSKK
jgi:plasmid stabilization system protein ParE